MANVQTGAYADWDKAMKREPSEFRYRSIAGIARSADYEGTGVSPEEGGEFDVAKEKARERIVNLIETGPLQVVDIVKITGCAKALFSNMKSGRRTFCVPARCWEPLAYSVMHTSVQDLIFGENRPIILPRKYAIPAAYMTKLLSEDEAKRLESISKRLVEKYYAENENDHGHHRPLTELLRERITDIKEEHGYYRFQIFGSRDDGKETPNCMKPNLAVFWDETKNAEPKYIFLAYAALYFRDQGMDYLVAEDPLRGFCDAYCVDKDGNRILLTGSIKQFWRNVLVVDAPRKQMLMEYAWGTIYSKLLADKA